MPTSQVPDEDAAMRMFSRKLRYLLANLCDLLDFWFARMKQRKASPRIAARHCNHAQVTASCPSEVTIGLPTMIFSFFLSCQTCLCPADFFLGKTHTYIYISIGFLLKNWKFSCCKEFLGIGERNPFSQSQPNSSSPCGGCYPPTRALPGTLGTSSLMPWAFGCCLLQAAWVLAEIRW